MCKNIYTNFYTDFAHFLHLHILHFGLHLRPREETVSPGNKQVKFLKGKNEVYLFDDNKSTATVIDFKKNKRMNFSTNTNAQDMVSVFYFLRRFFKMEDLNENNEISVNMFFDSENYVLKVKYLTSEFINTTFGKIYCYKIQPYVQSGRVFKKDESLTMWITADKNRIPIKMKANLLVGSVKIDLESFSSLTYPFEVQFD